ncbi:CYTH domain-containing protein [Hydrogenoanaerobacterium saccharovorans]|uniref:CYTH domain-containing protein n=1 Tax=Hydrogenoanaerobacterium saccharovorans TaxID=474960 RepID=A0A1H7ZH25_9FIRM|nr:CYTH domain-containing protein [Hydrogenoanaerobacterium saccharovorans]RPF48597.1 CYTH domain-containing protein [Hydrogenoanaerobacterium saccharovorans]SEM57710.1 CYTH domain-containing protein [Hydrogenoanaerobacterium saccharovorans]
MVELEKKYCITDSTAFYWVEDFLRAQENYAVTCLGEQMQTDTYYDTPSDELKNANVTLRIRKKANGSTLTIKCPLPHNGDSSFSERIEIEHEIANDALQEHKEFLQEHLGFLNLESFFEQQLIIKNKRKTFLLKSKTAVLEMVFDRVTYEDAVGKTAYECQLEIELKSGCKEELQQLCAALEQKVCSLIPTKQSKYNRGRQLLS